MEDPIREGGPFFDREEIPCTRYCHDGENERVREALNIAYGYAVAKVGWRKVEKEFLCLLSLHDYRGVLKVHYERPLSPLLVEALNEAWERCDECDVIYIPATT